MSMNLDGRENKELLKKLQDFGLSDKEARVYVALLPYRDIGSSKLIHMTGLHGQFVYDALARLEELGLAKHVIRNGRKKFSAGSPMRLQSLAEEKRLSVQSVARELQSRFAGAHEQEFEVFQGDTAFAAHQIDLLRQSPEGGTLDVFASQTEKYLETLEELGMAAEYDKLRHEKKISIRYIGAQAQEERLVQMEKDRPFWIFRILPGQSTGKISIEIWTNSVSFVVYSDPIFCFTITSKEVATGYRDFFNAVWKLSYR